MISELVEKYLGAEFGPCLQGKANRAPQEEPHPSTVHGANLAGSGVAKSATPETPRFTAVTAAVTGQSERAVQINAERGQKILSEVLDMIGKICSSRSPLSEHGNPYIGEKGDEANCARYRTAPAPEFPAN